VSELREEQRAAALRAVRALPGSTAYQVSRLVPAPPQESGLLFDLPPAPEAPIDLVMALLGELERDDQVYSQSWPGGTRWYPVPRAGE
jgi:hypothetical protein